MRAPRLLAGVVLVRQAHTAPFSSPCSNSRQTGGRAPSTVYCRKPRPLTSALTASAAEGLPSPSSAAASARVLLARSAAGVCGRALAAEPAAWAGRSKAASRARAVRLAANASARALAARLAASRTHAASRDPLLALAGRAAPLEAANCAGPLVLAPRAVATVAGPSVSAAAAAVAPSSRSELRGAEPGRQGSGEESVRAPNR